MEKSANTRGQVEAVMADRYTSTSRKLYLKVLHQGNKKRCLVCCVWHYIHARMA